RFRVPAPGTARPGRSAEERENLVSRPIEQTVAQNPFIKAPMPSDFGIRSISFPGLSLVYVQLDDSVTDTKKQFADINLKLNVLNDKLPQGAGPIQFNSDFGDTAALMLTVASPPPIQSISPCVPRLSSARSGRRVRQKRSAPLNHASASYMHFPS